MEAGAAALLQQAGGLDTLHQVWGGEPLSEVLAAVAAGRLSMKDAYRRMLSAMAGALQLPSEVFSKAALAQDDAIWAAPGSIVVYVRGHCDLRDQSLSRRQVFEHICVARMGLRLSSLTHLPLAAFAGAAGWRG